MIRWGVVGPGTIAAEFSEAMGPAVGGRIGPVTTATCLPTSPVDATGPRF
ncbi:hypothetical protein ACQP1W_43830 [Spirillospora sp. CA-255316]